MSESSANLYTAFYAWVQIMDLADYFTAQRGSTYIFYSAKLYSNSTGFYYNEYLLLSEAVVFPLASLCREIHFATGSI